MAKGAGQKRKTLILARVLLERTDEDHTMTVPELITALEAEGVTAERKSVYDDLEALRGFGLDVQSRKGRAPGWFIGERPFQLPELKLLVDAVQSCKFITRRKSDQLIGKLEGLTSVWQARQLQRQVYVDRRVKTMNESVYYSIDTLHAALAEGRGVRFRYFEYNVRKEKVFRREGAWYAVFPHGLIWDDENYYLVGYDEEKGGVRHYRVDKMAGLEITDRTGKEGGGPGALDVAAYAAKHFGMFSAGKGGCACGARTAWWGWCWTGLDRRASWCPTAGTTLPSRWTRWCPPSSSAGSSAWGIGWSSWLRTGRRRPSGLNWTP